MRVVLTLGDNWGPLDGKARYAEWCAARAVEHAPCLATRAWLNTPGATRSAVRHLSVGPTDVMKIETDTCKEHMRVLAVHAGNREGADAMHAHHLVSFICRPRVSGSCASLCLQVQPH